jgi:[protein-PII] uridylyltransferase
MALAGTREFAIAAQRSLEELREKMVLLLSKQEIPPDEVRAHFANLPQRYFISIPEQLVQHHIQVVHDFLFRQYMQGDTGLKPVVVWRDFPQQGHSEVTLVTWDREGVFAKICGALACVGLSILNADIYTRNDNIVIDTFRVSSIYNGGLMDERDKLQFCERIDRALVDAEFDFGDLFKRPARGNAEFEVEDFPTRITFDQRSSSEYTLLDIQTPDRPGLLYHLAHALMLSKVDIAYARITTEKGAALDTFYITDQEGNKVVSEEWQELISQGIRTALEV